MSLVEATFGSGGAEPYASALREGELLFLSDIRDRSNPRTRMDVSRWNADADDADLTLLSRVTGPVLDIGCGPGRMVRAAIGLGMHAIGIDVSPAALALASSLGGCYRFGSVFDRVPGERMWQTTLLVDGNIGIGGNIPALLRRCSELLVPGGEIVVELDANHGLEDHYLADVVDSRGNRSDPFPWAEIGLDRLTVMSARIGLRVVQSWDRDGRVFCRLASTT